MAKTTENKIEVVKAINEIVDSIKDNCQIAFDDMKDSRETGSKNAKEFAENFQFNDTADKVVSGMSGYMGEVIGAGYSMLLCPIKTMERNINKI